MKRVLALILTLVSTISLLNCSYVSAQDTYTLSQDQMTLLSYVGVYDAEETMDKKVTKGEFAGMLAKVAFGLYSDPEMYMTGKKAQDVEEAHLYYADVCALLSNGYISTNKFGNFQPDIEIDINTAYEFILRTMGYTGTDSFNQGKYARMASQKNISDNLVGNAEGTLTRINAYILIYNMLLTDISDIMSTIYNHVSADKELLYMENRLNLFKTKGIVTDDGTSSMYGETQIKEGYVSIENDVAMINETGVDNLIGKNIVGYFTKADNDELKLVCVYERDDKNTVYVLRSPNIIKPYQSNTYSYYDDEVSTKVKKLKVDAGATIIYNDRALRVGTDTITADDFIPENGIVRLYDNNNDGKMDVVRIENYQAAIATAVDKSTNRLDLCFKDTGRVLDLENKTYKIYNAKDQKITYNKIKEGDVISVIESLDGNYCKLLVSNDVQRITIEKLVKSTPTTRGYVKTTSGGKHVLSTYLDAHYKELEVGATYNFGLDVFGRVVYADKISSTNEYLGGYLVWIQALASDGGDVFARIYNDSGEWETTRVADKVFVKGEDDSENRFSAAELADSTKFNYTGIIRYKLNKESKINNIELPMYYGRKPTEVNRLYCVHDTVTTAATDPNPYPDKKYVTTTRNYMSASTSGLVIDNVAVATTSAKIFMVPDDITQKNEFVLRDVSFLARDNPYDVKVKVYSTDYRKFTADYVVLPAASHTPSSSTTNPVFVKNVTQTVDEKSNEVVYKLETIGRNGEAGTYYMDKDVYETGVFGISSAKVDNIIISAGDGIYPAIDKDSTKIVSATVFFDADQLCYDSNGNTVEGGVPGITTTEYFPAAGNYANPYAVSGTGKHQDGVADAWKLWPNGSVKIFCGWVYDYTDNVLTITNQNPEEGMDLYKNVSDGVVWNSMMRTNDNYLLHRPELGRIRNNASLAKGTRNQIKPYTKYGTNCSRIVVIRSSYIEGTTLIINKD